MCFKKFLEGVTDEAFCFVRAQQNDGLENALLREALCQSENYASAEFREGLLATKEKRKPDFINA